jgi:hypothetical protein
MNMKKILLLVLVVLLVTLSGCIYHGTTENTYNPDTKTYDTTKHTAVAWFSKQAVEGLTVGKRTSTGSTTLSVGKATTETQTDALRAVAEGAAAGAVKGARP